MPLTPAQLHANARVSFRDSDATVYSTNAGLTYLVDEDGEVRIVTTEVLTAEGSVIASDAQNAQELSDQERIAQLESELAAARGAQSAPAGTAANPAPSDANVTSPPPAETAPQQQGEPAPVSGDSGRQQTT